MRTKKQKTVDFIVVGSGIAGLNTALTLSPYGKVLIITKKKLNASSTYLAQGGIAAVFTKDDNIDSHVKDTLTAGYYHNKKSAVNLLVKKGASAVSRLIHLGVPFDKQKNGTYLTSFEAAHSYPRVLHATDFTGQEIEKVLISKVLKDENIEIWEDSHAIDLITKNNRCFGISIFKNNSQTTIFSRATILATGGAGQLYQWTTNPRVSTGDGIAIANRAKVKLSDLEFMQFHPTALKDPSAGSGHTPLLLLSEALRGEGAVLVDSDEEKFMQKYHKLADLAPRDVVARAIFEKQKTGEVYLDMRHKDKKFLIKRFPNIYRELKTRGYDLSKDLIPVTPAAHFMCGGIKTDIYGRTSVKNLFAYGEVAATGVHGANRLASNSLLEGMVFSDQIKKCVDELPKDIKVLNVIARKNDEPISKFIRLPRFLAETRNDIKNIMWEYVGLTRTTKELALAYEKLKKIQKEIDKSKGLYETILEVKNMLEVALLITESAKKRKQSLGTHFYLKN